MRHQHTTRTVTYEQAGTTITVQASIGKTVFVQLRDYAGSERTESRDFLIRTDDLIILGNPVLPKAGDKVRETVDSITYEYEVMAPGGEPHFRYSDPYRKTLRVHTKFIDKL